MNRAWYGNKNWVGYPLTIGNAYQTNRYELQVLLDNEDAENGKAWWVWSNQKNLKAILNLKKALEQPGASQKYGYDGDFICRVVVVTESRRLLDDPVAQTTLPVKKKKDIPDVTPSFSHASRSNFLD